MTTAVRHVLESFDALSDDEKHQAAAELLRCALQAVPPELPEEAVIASAEALFLELDAREVADGQS